MKECVYCGNNFEGTGLACQDCINHPEKRFVDPSITQPIAPSKRNFTKSILGRIFFFFRGKGIRLVIIGAATGILKVFTMLNTQSDPLSDRGYEEYMKGNIQEAITYYDKAIKKNPENADAYNNKCIALIDLDKYKEALDNCENALKYVSQDELEFRSTVYSNESMIYLQLGDLEKAKSVLANAFSLKPDNPNVLKSKASMAMLEGNYDEAMSYVDAALARVQTDDYTIDITTLKLKILTLNEDFEKAKSVLGDLEGKYTDNDYVESTLGLYYFSVGDLQKAKTHLLQAAKIYDKASSYWEYLARIEYSMGNSALALKYLDKTLGINKDLSLAIVLKSLILYDTEKVDQANQLFKSIYKRPINDTDAFILKIMFRSEKGGMSSKKYNDYMLKLVNNIISKQPNNQLAIYYKIFTLKYISKVSDAQLNKYVSQVQKKFPGLDVNARVEETGKLITELSDGIEW